MLSFITHNPQLTNHSPLSSLNPHSRFVQRHALSLFRWIALPGYTPQLFCQRWLAYPFVHFPIHGLELESNYGWL